MEIDNELNEKIVETGICEYHVIEGEVGGELWLDPMLKDWSVRGIVTVARGWALRELKQGGADLQKGLGGELICAGVPDEAPPTAHIAWSMLCLVEALESRSELRDIDEAMVDMFQLGRYFEMLRALPEERHVAQVKRKTAILRESQVQRWGDSKLKKKQAKRRTSA